MQIMTYPGWNHRSFIQYIWHMSIAPVFMPLIIQIFVPEYSKKFFIVHNKVIYPSLCQHEIWINAVCKETNFCNSDAG